MPNRFRVIAPTDVIFNYAVAMDVLFSENEPIIHAVYRQTHFSRAEFIPKQESQTIWSAFVTRWVLPYHGLPYELWVDQAKANLSV